MPNWLKEKSIQIGHRPALIYDSQIWTFRELEEISVQISEQLLHAGVTYGCSVAVLMDNHPLLVILIHALTKLNAIAILLNTRLTWREVLWQIHDSQAHVLIYSQTKDHVVLSLIKEDSSNLKILNADEIIGHSLHIDSMASDVKNREGSNGDIHLDSVQTIIYTSGTTGLPKGVQLTYGNHFHSAVALASHLGIADSDRWLICLPMFHIGGLSIIWRSVVWGVSVVLQPRFDVADICRAIATQQVSLISLVPTMLVRILESKAFRSNLKYWQKLKGILLGGAGASPSLIAQCLELKLPIMPTYGLTEAASQVTTLLPQDVERKLGSSGRPLACNHLRVAASDGEIGEISIKGANLMLGYLNHINAVSEGWFPTGDLGYLDSEGYLYVVNRRVDLIICGGENIYPAEIEAILLTHPDIKDVCVLGIEDREWGQVVGCAIATEKVLSLQEIREFCLSHDLASYKLPKVVHLVANLPRTATGKLLRQNVLS